MYTCAAERTDLAVRSWLTMFTEIMIYISLNTDTVTVLPYLQTDTQTHTSTDRQTHTDRHTVTVQPHLQTDTQTHTPTDRQTHTDRQTVTVLP